MTEEEYQVRVAKIRQRRLKLEENLNSTEFVFPPIDYDKEIDILIEEVDEILYEIRVDDFLESVDQLLIEQGYLNENKERISNYETK
jgi:hypothetical protein